MSEIGFVCVCEWTGFCVMDFLSFLHFTPQLSEKEEREMSQATHIFEVMTISDGWIDGWMDGVRAGL
jgi:hypothetical protein